MSWKRTSGRSSDSLHYRYASPEKDKLPAMLSYDVLALGAPRRKKHTVGWRTPLPRRLTHVQPGGASVSSPGISNTIIGSSFAFSNSVSCANNAGAIFSMMA